MRLVLEARVMSIKVSDVSVILVRYLITWVRLKIEQNFMTARDP